MTLVEVLVALSLLAAVAVPFGRALGGSLSTASDSGSRQDASALVSSVLSRLETIPYSDVGFTGGSTGTLATASATWPGYATAAGDTPTYYWDADADGSDGTFSSDADGDIADETLAVTSSDPPSTLTFGSDAVPFGPVMTGVDVGGSVFTVTTHIVDASGSVPACPGSTPATTPLVDAYRHVFVTATWSSGQLHGSVSADSIVYPGGQAPYDGPSSSSAVPPAPSVVTAQSTAVTGEVTVSWSVTVPNDGTVPGCFAVGWSGGNPTGNAQQESSSGLVDAAVSGTPTVNADKSTTYTYSDAYTTPPTLAQGQEYVFYVTSYSKNGVEWAQSSTSGTAQSPSGPLVGSVSPAAGLPGGGTKVTLGGTGLYSSNGPTLVYFGTLAASSVTCQTSGTSCTAVDPSSSGATGYVYVTAETPTGAVGGSEVSSPELLADEFSYAPSITSASYSGSTLTVDSGSTLTVDVANLSSISPPPTVTLTPAAVSQSSVRCSPLTSHTTTCMLTAQLPLPVAPATTADVEVTVSSTTGGTSPNYSLTYS